VTGRVTESTGSSQTQDESCIAGHLGERAPRGDDEASSVAPSAPGAAAAESVDENGGGGGSGAAAGDPDAADDVSIASDFSEGGEAADAAPFTADTDRPEQAGQDGAPPGGARAGTASAANGGAVAQGDEAAGARPGAGQSALDAFLEGAADPLRRHYQRCAFYVLPVQPRCVRWMLGVMCPLQHVVVKGAAAASSHPCAWYFISQTW
jgi:hypothetical protein